MLLIDASVYIFRAFHALPEGIVGASGRLAPVCDALGAGGRLRHPLGVDNSQALAR